jgi:2-hydroxychromene-2-carboxylate isomerase
MKHITFYLDFISPYAYLAFEQLPEALRGISHSVTYKPVLFAALLKHHGQLGPAEIAPKRDWTYRQVLWQAHTLGIPLDLPASHPFNPLGLLRLALACAGAGQAPNRYICETVLRHVWRGGAEAADAERLAALTAQLAPARAGSDPAVKAQLQANTDEALALGLFGVPSIVVDDKVFWGLDALPMLRAYLTGDPWFDGPWHAAASVAQGSRR